jgi:hypothetical protein
MAARLGDVAGIAHETDLIMRQGRIDHG